MPAPAVAAKVAVEAARQLHKRSPGGLIGGVAITGGVLVLLFGILAQGIFSALSAASSGSAAATCFGDVGGTGGGASDPSPLALKDIPKASLDAYMKAGAAMGIDWVYLAGLGKVESSHGTFGGRTVGVDGKITPPIIGVALNGTGGNAAIHDTDNGVWDGDTVWDRAVGPMQFIPSTWKSMGKDGNGDGNIDPNNMYDAAMGTAFYLRQSGAPADIRKAIFAYNHATWYVDKVMAAAASYRAAAGSAGVTLPSPTPTATGFRPIDNPLPTRPTPGSGGTGTATGTASPNPTDTGIGVPIVDDCGSTGGDITNVGNYPTGNTAWGGYQNGYIPQSALCAIPTYPSLYLRCDAAAAYAKMAAEFKQTFGHYLIPGNCYRDYATQVRLRAEKGHMAAIPGTSNHGWGLACDMADNINSYTSPEHRWMVAHANNYGWFLPPWAQQSGSKPEPWHWEFGRIS